MSEEATKKTNNDVNLNLDEIANEIDLIQNRMREMKWMYMLGLADAIAVDDFLDDLSPEQCVSNPNKLLEIKGKIKTLMRLHYELPFKHEKLENLIEYMNSMLKKLGEDDLSYNEWQKEECTKQQNTKKIKIDENKLMECLLNAACKSENNRSNEKDDEDADSKPAAKVELRRSPRNKK